MLAIIEMKRVLAISVVTMFSTTAVAQTMPSGTVPLFVSDETPGARHRLLTLEKQVLGECVGNCTFAVQPGHYVLEVDETDDVPGKRKKIDVTGPTLAEVRPGSKSTRTTGLVLGIVGPVAMVVGVIGILANNGFGDGEASTQKGNRSATAGFAAHARRSRRHHRRMDRVRFVVHAREDDARLPTDGRPRAHGRRRDREPEVDVLMRSSSLRQRPRRLESTRSTMRAPVPS